LLRRAEEIVEGYRVILEPSEELGFIGSAIEIPTVFADGRTPDACVKAVRAALTVAVVTIIEMGKRPPTGKVSRTEQVNIRLSAEEKLVLETAAAGLGFRGISDFVRAAAIEKSSSG
jgi:predicted RNase H-like HicB family nuclease